MSDDWFRTGIGPHFLDCLLFAERQISLTASNDREWPWTIVGLVGMAQAACALYLDERDTMQVATLSDPCMAKTIEALQHNSTKKVPEPFMAPPKILLKRVQEHSSGIKLSDKETIDLRNLMDIRNRFTHLTPTAWSLQTSGLPRMSQAAFCLAEKILLQPGIYNRLKVSERDLALKLCKTGMRVCEDLGIVH